MLRQLIILYVVCNYTVQFAFSATLRVSMEGLESSSLLAKVVELTNCSMAQFVKSASPSTNLKGASKEWDLHLSDIKFQNGADVTADEIESSLRQASFLDRQMIESITYKKNFSKITFKLPVAQPVQYLSWLIRGEKLSSQCGVWRPHLVSKGQVILSKGKQNIEILVESREKGMDRIKKGDVDVFIPLSWLEVDRYLRRNPGVKPLFSQEGRDLYFHLNPHRLSNLETRLNILRKIKQTVLPFPFFSRDPQKEKQKGAPKVWSPEFSVGSPAQVEWLFVTKQAIANLFSIVKSPRVIVLDWESLYAEVKAGNLDAWVSDQVDETVFFHTFLASSILGKSSWSRLGLDALIERSLLDDGALPRAQVYSILENEGLLTKLTSQNVVALVRAELAQKKVAEYSQLKFLENLF
jgi:hypothetical protein